MDLGQIAEAMKFTGTFVGVMLPIVGVSRSLVLGAGDYSLADIAYVRLTDERKREVGAPALGEHIMWRLKETALMPVGFGRLAVKLYEHQLDQPLLRYTGRDRASRRARLAESWALAGLPPPTEQDYRDAWL